MPAPSRARVSDIDNDLKLARCSTMQTKADKVTDLEKCSARA